MRRRSVCGFTLVEVLATMVLLAVVLPVAMQGISLAVRAADGHAFGFALLAGAAVVFALTYALAALESRRPVAAETRSLLGRAGVVGLAAAGVAIVAVAAVGRGFVERQVDEFANPPTELVTQEASRLTTLNSNNRWSWWAITGFSRYR